MTVKKRHVRFERVSVLMSAVLFLACVIYGGYLFIDFNKGNNNDTLKAVPIESYITLGYSEEEAEALNKLDPELQHVITQYEISEDSYALATHVGMTKDLYVRCQELNELFKDADCEDLIAMADKRGKEENDNIFMDDMYYIEARSERYEAAAALFYEEDYGTQEEYIRDIVEYVNCDGDLSDYENTEKTDTSKDLLMLVNKHYEYGRGEPEDLVTIDSNYGSGQIRDDVKEDLYDLIDAIRADGLELFVTRAYTSYDEQSELYDRYVSSYGESWAEMNTGHAGYSENQTGLSVDVLSYDYQYLSDFAYTEAAEWLDEHAYEYGFIVRYPDDEEYDTGYDYLPYHLRYVGKEVAQKIQQNDLLFDEYYAFYVD